MINLIYGSSGSGKSEFAEGLVCSLNYKNMYYLATMEAGGDEAQFRINRHRDLRKGKGFITLEHSKDIVNAIPEIEKIDSGDFSTLDSLNKNVILLECMSNLMANEMFRDGLINEVDYCVNKIIDDVTVLSNHVDALIIVTNNVFEDGNSFDEATENYLDALGQVNRKITEMSSAVYEVTVGIGTKL